MHSRREFLAKVGAAQDLIRSTAERYGVNQVCAAFSGGKDSQAVLRLCRSLYPHMIAIHNGHAGEDIHGEPGVLCVKEPKAENVPQFLKTVDMRMQFDGTRQDEDKDVIFDGVNIHRSQMPGNLTENGVWGLGCCYPLFDWTEEDVFQYLQETDPDPLVDSVRVSYEGEGPQIGMKTMFARVASQPEHPEDPEQQKLCSLSHLDMMGSGCAALYLNMDFLSQPVLNWINRQTVPVTVDIDLDTYIQSVHDLVGAVDAMLFLDATNAEATAASLWDFDGQDVFIKITVDTSVGFASAVAEANRFAEADYDVLLMPAFLSRTPLELGQIMIEVFSRIHPNVRIMPPVHHLLGID